MSTITETTEQQQPQPALYGLTGFYKEDIDYIFSKLGLDPTTLSVDYERIASKTMDAFISDWETQMMFVVASLYQADISTPDNTENPQS